MSQINTSSTTSIPAPATATQPTPPLAMLRRTYENAGLVFGIPCAGQVGGNPAIAQHPDLYHPILIERGWDGFLADAAARYNPLADRVRWLTTGQRGAMVDEHVPVMLRLPMGVDRLTWQQRAVLGPTLRGPDTLRNLAAMSQAFNRHFGRCTHVKVYVGPPTAADMWWDVLAAWRTLAAALCGARNERVVTICVDKLGVGINQTTMNAVTFGRYPLSQIAYEPAPIAAGHTEECWGCVIETRNWAQVDNHGPEVKRRPKRVWLLTQTGDNEGPALQRLLGWVRDDHRVSVVVHNDGWDKSIIDAVVGV